jgi:hypothetical protein
MARFRKPLLLTTLFILAVAGALVLREYILLRRLKAVLTYNGIEKPDQRAPSIQAVSPPQSSIVRDVHFYANGNEIRARVNFAEFKRFVEANAASVRGWGKVIWKVLDDTPALCLKSLATDTPLRPLAVRSGDCITMLDGETINQPLRNLGIWLSLSARSNLKITTLRKGREITYHLTRI